MRTGSAQCQATPQSMSSLSNPLEGDYYKGEAIMATVLNGVNVDNLVATVGAVKANTELAKFKFRSMTEWVEGGHSRTTIQSFFGVGAEDASRLEAFVIEGDEPTVLLGTN